MKLHAALVAIPTALSLPIARAGDSPPIDVPYERLVLDNGLEVLLHQDHAVPIVHVELWYHVGSKDEVAGRSGFAHLFEHLMFNGAKHWDAEYFEPLSSLGANVNGSTNTDRTNYYETVPSNALQRALWMEADRMGFLLDALTIEKLNNQRDVVRNERRQRYEIAPYAGSRKAIAEAVWPASHPYHHLTIGSHEDLEAATLDDVKAFFRTWYVPNNATLCLAGDFDRTQAETWIRDYFGPLPRGAQPQPVTQAPAEKPKAQDIVLDDRVQLPRVHYAWQSPALFAPGDADLDVLSLLLTDGKNSRLYKRLVFESRIAKDVGAYQASSQLGSVYVVQATVAPGHTVEEVEAALQEEIDRVRAEAPSADELERAQNAWRKSFYQRIESVVGRGGMLLSYGQQAGDPGYVGKDLARYLAVTPQSVLEAARSTLDPAHRVRVLVQPGEGGAK